jgi:serine phosphatase RsbU (regulator of sigma subunit)
MMMVVIFLLTLYSKSMTLSFEKIITLKNEQLSGAYKDIKDSIIYAKRLQEAILPSESYIKSFLPKSFILYKPKDIVAGDFYWFHASELPSAGSELRTSPNELFIAAADCTGHGVPGAMVSVVCSNALNRAVVELGITDPGKILDKVRDLVIETFEKSKEEVRDGMDISLVSLKELSNGHVLVRWAGANNPLWFISNGKFNELKPDKQPIGKHINLHPFTSHSVELRRGDTIFLFTDGYADQFGGPKGKKFKYKQLAQLLLENGSCSAEEQKRLLEESFENWRRNYEQLDDVCVVGIQL